MQFITFLLNVMFVYAGSSPSTIKSPNLSTTTNAIENLKTNAISTATVIGTNTARSTSTTNIKSTTTNLSSPTTSTIASVPTATIKSITTTTTSSAIPKCTSTIVRREWREFPKTRKEAFIAAIKCLKKTPSILKIGSPSFWYDMVYIHRREAVRMHDTAQFLPWHREFMTIYETGLRQFCNYNEGIPYFDYSLDSQAPDKSPIWDWFGKNGDPKTKCITGNLQGLMGNYLPNPKVTSCVKRDWLMASKAEGGPLLGAFYSPQQISTILKNKNYNSFRIALENGPHNNFHMAIGGDMYDPDTSPNDPIFFMHHANIDRLWAVWQSQNPSVAFTYFGNTDRGSNIQNAKPSDVMNFRGMVANKTVGSVLDLSARCIEYSNSVTPSFSSNLLKKRDLQIQVPELYNTTTPDSHNREELFNLRYVSPLSIEFLKKFKYSDSKILEIKLQESQLRVYTDFLNSLPLDYSGSLADFIDGQENGWRSKTDMEMQGDLRLYMALTDAVAIV